MVTHLGQRISDSADNLAGKGYKQRWLTCTFQQTAGRTWTFVTKQHQQGLDSGKDLVHALVGMDPSQSLYDTPGSLMDYGDRRDEPWQTLNDEMELRLVGKNEQEKSKTGVHTTLNRSNPLTIGPKFCTLGKSADDESIAYGLMSSKCRTWKYVLGLVVLLFSVSVLAVILASMALNNSSERSVAGEKLLQEKQNAYVFTLNSSGMFLCVDFVDP